MYNCSAPADWCPACPQAVAMHPWPPPTSPDFTVQHDATWYRTSLCPDGASCPGSVSSQLLVHPKSPHWKGSKEKLEHPCLCVSTALQQVNHHCVISIKSKTWHILTPMKKINLIPADYFIISSVQKREIYGIELRTRVWHLPVSCCQEDKAARTINDSYTFNAVEVYFSFLCWEEAHAFLTHYNFL